LLLLLPERFRGETLHLHPVNNRGVRPLAPGEECQSEAEYEKGCPQAPGEPGQEVASAAGRHEASRPATHTQRASLGTLDKNDGRQTDADDNVEGEQ